MTRTYLIQFFLTASLLLLSGLSAMAGQQRLIDSYKAWKVYVFYENNAQVCYMASQPVDEKGDYTKRGEPFVLITDRPKDGTRDVFSYVAGYTYKAGSEAKAIVDGKEFPLYTQDNTAWGPDSETDKNLAKAIREGSTLIIKGVSSRGTQTTDKVSLSGSASAYKRMKALCR